VEDVIDLDFSEGLRSVNDGNDSDEREYFHSQSIRKLVSVSFILVHDLHLISGLFQILLYRYVYVLEHWIAYNANSTGPNREVRTKLDSPNPFLTSISASRVSRHHSWLCDIFRRWSRYRRRLNTIPRSRHIEEATDLPVSIPVPRNLVEQLVT